MVSQRPTTMLNEVDQLSLLPVRKPPAEVDKSQVLALGTLRAAIRYSISLADLEPKQVYDPLSMDKAVWSRIDNGLISFPSDRLLTLANITRNDAPLMWLANRRGYDLRPQKSELQEQLESERAANAELRRQLETITAFVRETRR